MSSDFFAVMHASLENKIGVDWASLGARSIWVWGLIAGIERSEEHLNDMITVYVCGHIKDIGGKLINYKNNFLAQILHVDAQTFN